MTLAATIEANSLLIHMLQRTIGNGDSGARVAMGQHFQGAKLLAPKSATMRRKEVQKRRGRPTHF